MMLWIIFALLVLLALAALLVPLLRRSAPSRPRGDYDMAVYHDQLAELGADEARGLVAPDQAGAARAEIERRALAAAQAGEPAPLDEAAHPRWRLAAALAVALPLASGVLYHALGSPALPGEPYAKRAEASPATANSAEGYRQLADRYVAAHKFGEAAEALERAVALGGDDAATWAKLGEAIALDNGGAITPPALAAFTHALMRDAREPRARFYAGIAEAQIGHFERAVSIWRDLERDTNPNAKWAPLVRAHIDAFAKQGGFNPNSVAPQPPSIEAMNAALQAMSSAAPGQ